MNSQIVESSDFQNKEVYSILQKSIDRDQMILNRMLGVERNVEIKFAEITELVQEVRDSVTLTNAECTMMQSAVRTKAIALTKDRYVEEDGDFKTVVGKHLRMIWKQLKEKYGVPKYNCIRRIDFEEATEFVHQFKIEDYM
jgi:hypothetical protein